MRRFRPLVRTLVLSAAALLAAAGAPARAAAQEPADTVPARPDAPADTAAVEADTARRLPARWARPFAVEARGRAAPRRTTATVAYVHPDSLARPARERLADADSTPADTAAATERDEDAADRDPAEAAPARTAPGRSSSGRTAARDSVSRTNRPASRDSAARTTRTASRDSVSRSSRTASRDSTPRTTRTAPRDTASRTTRTASRDEANRTTRTNAPASGRTSAGAGSRPRTHTVAAGETFYGIARRYGVTSAQLRALNPEVEWQSLEIGTVLRLPAGARAPGSPSQGTGAASTPSPGRRTGANRTTATQSRRRTHTVARGETLFGIARRYGVTVDALRRANDLDEDDGLRTGQTLTIPPAAR